MSNIVWEHPHESVPRAYRDIIVTEYGIADLRGQRDEDAIARMLAITDSRFQDELLDKAKSAGKVARDFTVEPAWRANTPESLARWLAPHNLPDFPFGTDFDAVERRILPALGRLSETQGNKLGMARLVLSGMTARKPPEEMARMGLDRPGTLKDRLEAWALAGALQAVTKHPS